MSNDTSARPGTPVRDEPRRLCSHADVVAAATDAAGFSSAVSRYLQVPNGLDGAEHRDLRALLDPFMSGDEVDVLEPVLQRIADDLVGAFADGRVFDAVHDLGAVYAVRAQSAWLGWSGEYEDDLLAWVADNRDAVRGGDPARLAASADRFDALVARLLDERRAGGLDDATTRLMTARARDPRATGADASGGRPLTDAEIVSILRNWTGGDLSSLALCAGVVAHWLAANPHHQGHLRGAGADELDAAIDEILRADDPFVSNRRLATRDSAIGGCPHGSDGAHGAAAAPAGPIRAGEVVVLDWRAANRDPRVFADPDAFDPVAHAADNLVWGAGPHACPGRELATRELRVLVQAVLRAGSTVFADDERPTRESAPVAGYRTVPVRIVRGGAGAPGRAS